MFWKNLTTYMPQAWNWLKRPVSVARGLVAFLTVFFLLTVWDSCERRDKLKSLQAQFDQNKAYEKAQRDQVIALRKERSVLKDSLKIIEVERQKLDSANAKLYTEIKNWSDAGHYRAWQRLSSKRRSR